MEKMVDSSILILIPTFNGIKTLPRLLEDLKNLNYTNIHVVDDGSKDGTGKFLRDSEFSFSLHKRNLGKGAAILTGAKWAIMNKYNWILTIDADLQHSPAMISKFLEFKDEKTMVLGSRKDLTPMPLIRRFSNKFSSLLLSIRSNNLIEDSQCGFRLIPAKLFMSFNFLCKGFQFESEILIKAIMAGYRIIHVEIPTIYKNEISSMKNIKDTIKFAKMYFHSFLW
tara:strand:+ start:230 stop:904 length:675 start_codon:yes stop_codon:yes gene_type:complete